MKSYNQIKVTVPTELSELTQSIMTAMDFIGGLMIEDYSDIEMCEWDYIDEDLLNKDKSHCSISGFVSVIDDYNNILENLKLLLPNEAKIEVIGVKEEDWANNWKKYYKPTKVGKRVVIKPTWEDYLKKDDEVIIELDPGMAFGTGTHETTKMCIGWLEEFVKPNTTVLDVGCGSGILGICAIKLGAKSCYGIDLDPVAVETSIKNGNVNGISSPEFVVERGDLVEKVNKKYDIVCANIIADVIIILSPQVKDYINENGVLICSGIINDRVLDVKNQLIKDGYKIINEKHDKEWVSLVCKL